MNMPDLKGRSLLTLLDFTAEEISYLIDYAIELNPVYPVKPVFSFV